ncbi:hypothetical protein Q1695_014467 [Nippostrongylus brasiliensis]|nr:hypothetical protein Q1695_014467 [Nippostrongylus brasiliensis]
MTERRPTKGTGILMLIVTTIASIIFAIIFVVIYVTMSELHRGSMKVYQSMFGVLADHVFDHFWKDMIWIIDGIIACFLFFWVLEDIFLLYELNCDIQFLNAEAYLSLREALETDNRYLKDAIILEAKEQQEPRTTQTTAHETNDESTNEKISVMMTNRTRGTDSTH